MFSATKAKLVLVLVGAWLLLVCFGYPLPSTATGRLTVPAEMPVSVSGSAYYAAPDGSAAGDGTLAHPWDLQTAFSHPPAVQPGDTIWLRGGIYTGIFTSSLVGTAAAPITVRSYPGEWAVINTQATAADSNAFVVNSHWTDYWGFELLNSRLLDRGGGIEFYGRNNRLINLVIHDMARSNSYGGPNEIYGCLFYNNGLDGGQGHQLYTQNEDSDQPARIVDSIIFNGFAFGVHAYAGGVGLLNGIHLVGNVWFNNGVAQTLGERKDNVLVGGVNGAESILLQENMGWAPANTVRSVALGRYGDLNEDVTLIDNYLIGDTKFYNTWQSVTMSGNTFYSLTLNGDTNVDPSQHPDNTYLATRPTGVKIFVRPNQYESGRAHLVVYNWDLADTVAVDVSAVLIPGNTYEVRNAQNYFAPPVLSGIYDGGMLTLPLAGLAPAQPIGSGLIEPAETTGKEFNVFVLLTTGDDSHKAYLPSILGDPIP